MAEGVRFDVEQHQDKDWVRVEDEVVTLGLGETLRLHVTNAGAATVWVAPIVRREGYRLQRHGSKPADTLELAPGASSTLTVTLSASDYTSIGLIAAATAKSAKVDDYRALKRQLVGERSIKVLPSADTVGFDDDAAVQTDYAVLCIPCALVLRSLADEYLDTFSDYLIEPAAWGGLILTFGATIGYVRWTGYWRRWLFWQAPPFGTRPVRARVIEVILMVPLLTYFFVYLHAFLFRFNVIGASTKVPFTDILVESVERFYLWHLIKSIPLLELPDTFDLKPPVTFTGVVNGLLVLTYRLLVLVPAIGLGLSALQHWLERHRDTSSG